MATAARAGRCLVLLGAAALAATGCAGTERRLSADASQRVIDAPAEVVFPEALEVVRREFGRVAESDARAGWIESAPGEYQTTSASGSARDFYGAASRMRRVARVQLAPRGSATLARVRVDVERLDTQRSAARPTPSPFSDAPAADSAFERDAATTERQNQVWTRVRREAALERELLEELRDLFATDTPAPAPAAPAPAPVEPGEDSAAPTAAENAPAPAGTTDAAEPAPPATRLNDPRWNP